MSDVHPHYLKRLLERVESAERRAEEAEAALASVEADLVLVEASFSSETDPMRAIDAPAWVDNALGTIRAMRQPSGGKG